MSRVLIVEDEIIIAEDLKMIIESWGHEVIGIAASGKRAIQISRQEEPDIIFMDIQLQGVMNGIETAQKILQNIDAKLIFCSAYNDNEALLKASVVNPLGYIVKPFELEDIKNIFSSGFLKDPCNSFNHNELMINQTIS